MSGERVVNWPNALCVLRFVGSIGLLPLGWTERPIAFVALLIVLALIDWLDGKLAIWLDQRTEVGAKLDTYADVFMYAALGVGAWWLKPELLRGEALLIAVAAGSYAASMMAGLIKFGRPPTYHTRGAKTCWLLIGVGAALALLEVSVWPLRVALAAVVVTNVEAIAITCVLRERRSDVPSVYHAWRMSRCEARRRR